MCERSEETREKDTHTLWTVLQVVVVLRDKSINLAKLEDKPTDSHKNKETDR